MIEPARTPRGGNLLLEFGAIPLRRWRMVGSALVLTLVASVLVTLVVAPSYLTSTTIVPFSGGDSRSQIALGSLPAGMANLVGASFGVSPAERLVNVLIGSRMLNDSIARHAAASPKEMRDVYTTLFKGTRIQHNPDGSIVIQVRAKDPQLAARVANTYPQQLNQALAILSTEGAMRKQAFLRVQIDTAQAHVALSEQRLLDFQRHQSAPAIDQQALRTIDAAVALQQGIYKQEIEVAQLRRTATPNNPELRAAQAELELRKQQLKDLTTARGGRTSDVFVPMGQSPELKSLSEHLLRSYTQDERIYESLVAGLTDAQIDANNNLPVFSVLDSALVPDKPSRSWATTIIIGMALGLMLGLIAALVADGMEGMRRNPDNAPFFDAWDGLRTDIRLRRARNGSRVTNGDGAMRGPHA